MSVVWGFAVFLVFVLVAVGLYFGFYLRKLGTPTKGARIDLSERPDKALIVIDVQEDFTRNEGKHGFEPKTRDDALSAINREIEAARSNGVDVAFVKNIFRDWPVIQVMKLLAGGIGTPGRTGLKLDRALETADAPVFEKAIGDTFSNPDFETWLAERNVGSLTLVGLDACHCVQLTAKGALSRGFHVEIREPATPGKWSSIKNDLAHAGIKIA